MSTTAPQATYVYGVLSAADKPPATTGIGGAPLQEITSDGLAALVSDLSEQELVLGREEMTTHARVLEEAVEHGTVLPMRFGVVMEGEDAVKHDLLEAHRESLQQQLQDLTGKVELRVRAMYEEQAIMREIVSEDPEIANLRESLHGADEDATYYGRIQLGELVAAAVEDKREADAAQLLDTLAPLALDTRVGDPTHERMVVSASFLVDRDRMSKFDEAVDKIGQAQASRMRIKYVGPLPPHSFVDLQPEE